MKTVVYDHQIFSLQRFGGISRYFCEIASRIKRESGWQSRVVAPVYCNKHLADSAVSTRGFYLRSTRMENLREKFNRWMSPILSIPRGADIKHQTYYADSGNDSRTPRVVTVFDMIHELFPQYFPLTDSTAKYKKRTVEQADHIVCISNQTADDLMAVLRVPREKITVTHLGFSRIFSDSRFARDNSFTDVDRPYLLYVGHRSGYKNFARVLEAFASSRMLTDEFDLVAFGGGRFTVAEMQNIDNMRLRPGAVRQESGDDEVLAKLYNRARVFVYPSEYEGFGIPPLEAMASRCVVACSNASAVPEVVGDAGEYFDPKHVESIREALETVSFSESRRNELIKAGSLRCQMFSWSRCADETLRAYDKLLSASN